MQISSREKPAQTGVDAQMHWRSDGRLVFDQQRAIDCALRESVVGCANDEPVAADGAWNGFERV